MLLIFALGRRVGWPDRAAPRGTERRPRPGVNDLGMRAWDAIRARRDVRQFADRRIADQDLDRILEAGRRSPSSQNWQPWDFPVVTDRAQLQELPRVCRGAGHVAGSAATIALIGTLPADDDRRRASLRYTSVFQ
jgi:nitroreductase